MLRYEGQIINRVGVPINGASVTIRVANIGSPGTGALATIYSDEGITPIINPVGSDANGRYWFYIADGKYDITFTGTGITTYTRANIEIADFTDTGAGAVLTAPAGSQTITQPANTSLNLVQSVSGASATNALIISPTWNTSGNPTAFQVNVTNTASGASALLADLIYAGASKFKVDKNGAATLASDATVSGVGRFQGQGPGTGSYGRIFLNSGSGFTSGARRFLVTNSLTGNKFAIIRSVDATTDPTLDASGVVTSGTTDFSIDNTGIISITNGLQVGGAANSITNGIEFGGATSPFILIDQINTGTQALLIQAGRGSAAYGGSAYFYGHSHATYPGWVRLGISSGSGGKFAVNNQATAGGTDVFYIDAAGSAAITGTTPNLNVIGPAATNRIGLSVSGTTTGYNVVQATNTSGNLVCGVNTSTGAGLVSNSTAYSGVLATYTATPLELGTNVAIRIRIASTGETTFLYPADKTGTASIITDSAAINTTETVIVKSGALLANRLAAGTVIRAVLEGTCTASAANTSTFQIRIGTAGTIADTLVFSGVTAASATTGTAVPFRAILEMTVKTTGAAATAMGFLTVETTGGTATGISTVPVQVILPTMTTFNTTTANNIVSVTYKSAATTTTSTFKQAFIEVVYL